PGQGRAAPNRRSSRLIPGASFAPSTPSVADLTSREGRNVALCTKGCAQRHVHAIPGLGLGGRALEFEQAEGGEFVRDQDVEEPAAQCAEDRLDLVQAAGHPDHLGDPGQVGQLDADPAVVNGQPVAGLWPARTRRAAQAAPVIWLAIREILTAYCGSAAQ